MYGSHSVAAVHSRLIGIKGELWKNGGLVRESPVSDIRTLRLPGAHCAPRHVESNSPT